MVESTAEQVSTARRRYLLGADAFLYSGVLFMAANLALMGVGALVGGYAPSLEWINMVLMAAGILAGAAFAWRSHGHPLGGPDWIALIVGTLLLGPPASAGLIGLFSLSRFIPNPVPRSEGPWGLVLVVSAVVIGALVVPFVDAVRELRIRREHVALARTRIAALMIIAVAVIVSIFIGGEAAEIGLFMTLFAVPGVCGVLVADLFELRRQRRTTPAG